jgi:flavoprotein
VSDLGCAGSALGRHDEGERRDGRCVWCGEKYRRAQDQRITVTERLSRAELVACSTCYAIVPESALEIHNAWHDAIAAVAIESTKRIDCMEAVRAAMISQVEGLIT